MHPHMILTLTLTLTLNSEKSLSSRKYSYGKEKGSMNLIFLKKISKLIIGYHWKQQKKKCNNINIYIIPI